MISYRLLVDSIERWYIKFIYNQNIFLLKQAKFCVLEGYRLLK